METIRYITDNEMKFSKSIIVLVGMAMKQPDDLILKPNPNRSADKTATLVQIWGVFTIFTGVAYTALLFVSFIQPEYTATTDTLHDLVTKPNKYWIGVKGTAYEGLAMYKPLGKNAIFATEPEQSDYWMKTIKEDSKYSIMITSRPSTMTVLKFPGVYDDMKKSNYYVSKQSIAEYWAGITMRSNSPLQESINRIVIRLFYAGITAQNQKFNEYRNNLGPVTVEQMLLNQAKEKLQRKIAALSIFGHLSGAFAVLLIGWGLSGLAFFLEIIVFRNNTVFCF
jgi:hypothetical protein